MSGLSLLHIADGGNIVYSLVDSNGEAVAKFDWRCTPNQAAVVTIVNGSLIFMSLKENSLDSEVSIEVMLDECRKSGLTHVVARGIVRWEVKGTTLLCWVGDTLIATISTVRSPSSILLNHRRGEDSVDIYFTFMAYAPGYSAAWDERYTPILISYSEHLSTFKF